MQNSFYVGKQIGNYRITNVLASGSFGTVFLAHHLYLKQRVVVVKFLHAIRLDSEEEKAQFLQEAQILEMLRGLPHILPLLDVGVEGESAIPYLITEYAERGSLRQRMKEYPVGHFPLREALMILSQLGQGLQAAHDRQIVHRDLKPENILFNAANEALLADFGISTVLTTASVKQTAVVGTPAYMAPEQFRGEVSKESDQYALACIAYELLTGLKPFNAPDIVSMGFMHTSEDPIPPREHNFYIPAHVEHAILKALSKRRTDRFPSVFQFIEALLHESRRKRSNTRPLMPAEQEVDDQTLPKLPPTITASPVPASAASSLPTPAGQQPHPSVPSAASALPAEAHQPSPPPLYLPGPPDSVSNLSTPLVQSSDNHAGAGSANAYRERAPAQTPPPYAYGPQNASIPPERPRSPQPGRDQASIPPPHSGQAQMYAPRPYPEVGYHVPGGPGPTPIPFNLRALAAACYLLPILSWLLFFRVGLKNRFARFHFAQAVLGWLAWLLYARLIQNLADQDLHVLHDLVGLGIWVFLIALVMVVIRALQGRLYRVWLIGPLAEALAGRWR